MPTPRPSSYLNWIPSGSPSYIQQPSGGQATTGWVALEAPPFQYANWLEYTTDQWIQYLDQTLTGGATGINANSLVLATTGTIAIGSNQLTAASVLGVLVGHAIAGTGISAGTFVVSISGLVVTMSRAATSNQTAEPITFSHKYATGSTVQKQLDELDGRMTQSNYADVVTVDPGITPLLTLSDTGDNRQIYGVKSNAGVLSIQLPEPMPGFEFTVKDVQGNFGTNQVTLLRHGSEKIDGTAANYPLLSAFGAYRIWSDGTDWFIMTGFSAYGSSLMRRVQVNTPGGVDPVIDFAINLTIKWQAAVDAATNTFFLYSTVLGTNPFAIDAAGVGYFRGGSLVIEHPGGGDSVLTLSDNGVSKWKVFHEHSSGQFALEYMPSAAFTMRMDTTGNVAFHGIAGGQPESLIIDAPAANAILEFQDSGVSKWQTYNDHPTGNYTIRYVPGGIFPFFMDTVGNAVLRGTFDAGARVSSNTGANPFADFEFRDSGIAKWRMRYVSSGGAWKLTDAAGSVTPLLVQPTGETAVGTVATATTVRGAPVYPDYEVFASSTDGVIHTVPDHVPGSIITPTSTAITIFVVLPALANLKDGQEYWISQGDQAGSLVTVGANSGTQISGGSFTIADPSNGAILIYRQANQTWYFKTPRP